MNKITPKIPNQVDVYDVPSGMGGSFTVSIIEKFGPDDHMVELRVWYGRATDKGWEPWPEWDGAIITRKTNPRIMRTRK